MSQQALGAVFAVATCATVAFRQRYPTTAGVTAQGLMALDFLTWHNLAAGGWTIAWFCSLYGLAVWSSRWRFAAGTAFVAAVPAESCAAFTSSYSNRKQYGTRTRGNCTSI